MTKPSLTIRTDIKLREIIEVYANERGISISAAVNIALFDKFKKIKEV